MKSLICEQCGGPIPPERARHECRTFHVRFCSKECDMAWRRESGLYQRWSEAANAAQARHKAKHGEVPGYKQRREGLARSNREHPRRSRKA